MKRQIEAFPSCGADGCGPSGMSLRDYFAAKALPAQMTFAVALAKESGGEENQDAADIARFCYAIADAMLAERSK